MQFAQVAQPVVQLAQLNVIQPARGFFAVTGDEGHRGPAVQQLDGGFNLFRPHFDFKCYLVDDGLHV